MLVRSLGWVGVRTRHAAEMVAFYRDDKAMKQARVVGETAHELAAIVDVTDHGLRRAREIDLGGDSIVHDEPMGNISGIPEQPHDLAAIIDPADLCFLGAGKIDLAERAAFQEKSVGAAAGIDEQAHNLAAIIDPGGSGAEGPGNSNRVKFSSS